MPIRRRIPIAALGWFMAFFMLGGILPVHSRTTPEFPPVLQVRIRGIEQVLQTLDTLAAARDADPSSQTAIIKGLLQGTDWIDPSRSIVMEMFYDGKSAAWLVLVPFLRPNENFQRAYGALAGDDHYVLRFPAGNETPLPGRHRENLLQASARPAEANILVELAAHDVLLRSGPEIEAGIQNMASRAAAGEDPSVGPDELQGMVRDALATFKQVESLRFGLNLDPEALLLLVDIEAVKDSFLAGLLNDQETDMRLGDYQPDYPMQFRSRAYNVAGFMQLLGASFGGLYRRMGFDFDEMAELAKGLTGEMAGGMALDQRGVTFETIYRLHDTIDGEDYLTRVYLPWFEKYNHRMATLMEEQTGHPVKPLYERAPETTVAGKRVIGVRTRFPMSFTGIQSQGSSQPREYETRMTAVDNLILAASSDAVIARLIAAADKLKYSPGRGPLAGFSMDLGAYLVGLQRLMPASGPDRIEIPADMGGLTMEADMNAGRLTTRTRMKTRDVQRMVALLDALAARAAAPALAGVMDARAPAGNPASVDQGTPHAPEGRERPQYWMDRGGLVSAYGNYTAAVRCYQKALALAPEMAEAHFQLGVALGELGQFEAAVISISRAIDREPAQGAYWYGRGRIYLRAGDTDLAMRDFMEAGFLGNRDARDYLRPAGVDWN